MSSAGAKTAVLSGAFTYGALDDLEAYIREKERAAEEAARAVELQVFLEEEEAAQAAYLECHAVQEEHSIDEDAETAAQLLEVRLDEAGAVLARAEFQLTSANYGEALRLARSAWSSLDEVGNSAGTAAMEAQALRLIVKAHAADDDFELALGLAYEQLRYFRLFRHEEAEIVTSVSIAEVFLAMKSPKSGLRAVSSALASARRLQAEALIASTLQTLARVHLQLGRPVHVAAALDEVKEALQLHEKLGNGKEEAAALLTLSRAHVLRQEYDEAFGYAGKSGEISRDMGCKTGEAAAWKEAAMMLLAAERLDEALEAAQEAVKMADGSDPPGEIAAHQAVASVQQGLGRPQEALEALEVALSLAQELADRRHIREALDAMIQIHIDQGATEEALQMAHAELQLASSSGGVRRSLDAFQRIASLQLSLERCDEAVRTANDAVDALGASGDKRVVAKALQLVAEVQAATGHRKQALAVVAKALSHLKGVGSVRDLAALWQFTFVLHTEMGDNEQALKSRQEEQKVYRLAGWKDEEAALALSIAELLLPLRGPEEAVGAAKEALKMFEDLDDKQGKADALLRLAQMQVLSGAADEAAGNVLSARRLFQSFSDTQGEANALLVFADAYFEKGRGDQALRLARDALAVCRDGADEHHERQVLQTLASMQAALLQKRGEGGPLPDQEAVREALDSCVRLSDVCAAAGDAAGHASALALLSTVHCAGRDGHEALQTAEGSLRLASELDDTKLRGSAKLASAQAHLLLGEGGNARKAAEEAVSLLKDVADGPGVEKATQIILLAHTATRKPAVPSVLGSRGIGNRLAGSKVVLEHGTTASPSSAPLSHVSPSQYGRQPRAAAPGQRAPAGPPPQLAERAEGAPARARPRKKGAAGGVKSILLVVRPDWGAAELQLAQEDFGKIGIESMTDLFSQLRTGGVKGVNDKFRAAGCPEMDEATLEGLREVACRGMSEYD